MCNVSDDDEEDAQQQPVTDSDTVMDEVDRWSKLDKVTIKEFRDDAGIVNEFALHAVQATRRVPTPLHRV